MVFTRTAILSAAVCAALSAPAATAQDTTSNLKFHLSFDGKKTDTVTGSLPIYEGATSAVQGKFGQALSSDEGLIYDIELPTDTWTEGTAAAWVKVAPDAGNNMTVLATRWHSQLHIQGDKFTSATGSGNWATSPITVPRDSWVHLAMVWTRSGDDAEVDYYFDGQLTHSETVPYRKSADYKDVRVGRWGSAGATNYLFKGALDDVAVYDRALSAADVTALHAGPIKAGVSGSIPILNPKDVGVVAGPVIGGGPLTVPTDRPLTTPKEFPRDLPESVTRKGSTETDWEIVSVRDQGGNANGLLEARENLSFEVKLRKTGVEAPLPVRIQAKQVQPDANWKGTNPGIKYNIYGEVGEIVAVKVPVNYQTRFEAGVESYVFNLELVHPDGSPLKDANTANNTKRMNYNLLEKREARAEAEAEAARKEANKGYKRRLRRSGLAGRSGDRIWRHVAPKGAILNALHLEVFRNEVRVGEDTAHLSGNYLSLVDGVPTTTQVPGLTYDVNTFYHKELDAPVQTSGVYSDRPDWATFALRGSIAKENHILNDFGIRNPFFPPTFELWKQDITGDQLGQNRERELQWQTNSSDSHDWSPWQFCPKDDTGQYMVAVGFEAHVEELNWGSYLNGIRLICEPLSQALDPRDGPIQYFNSNTGKWQDG